MILKHLSLLDYFRIFDHYEIMIVACSEWVGFVSIHLQNSMFVILVF